MSDAVNRVADGAKPGYDALWGWFGLDRASFLTMPRVLMHSMPDEWQARMAKLLEEYDDTWDFSGIDLQTFVQAKRGNKFVSFPEFLTQYRHPCRLSINALRRKEVEEDNG